MVDAGYQQGFGDYYVSDLRLTEPVAPSKAVG
jgi:hypothetical protein